MTILCFNRLVLGGRKADVDACLADVTDSKIDLGFSSEGGSRFIDELKEKWGRRTDAIGTKFWLRPGAGDRLEAYFEFDTNGTPPRLSYRQLAQSFPTIDIRAVFLEPHRSIFGGMILVPDEKGSFAAAIDYERVPKRFMEAGMLLRDEFTLHILNALPEAPNKIANWPEDPAPTPGMRH